MKIRIERTKYRRMVLPAFVEELEARTMFSVATGTLSVVFIPDDGTADSAPAAPGGTGENAPWENDAGHPLPNAASFAGAQKLGKLTYLYDSNRISIEGSTDLTFSENTAKRFKAYGWHTYIVKDGNDTRSVNKALKAAKRSPMSSSIRKCSQASATNSNRRFVLSPAFIPSAG